MTPTGRFKSQILSRLSQQTLRLRDRTQELIRRAQITASWVGQIALYPVYLAFQSTRLALQQASQSTRQILVRLGMATAPPTAALPADTPIQKTLQAVQTLAMTPASSTTLAPIQGVATLLDNRSLVLVSTQNQPLDVLTPQQQHDLQRQMVYELASYYRDRHRFVENHAPALLPPVQPDADQMPPVRWFLRAMNWVQRGQVAIAVDLFQESALALYFPEELPADKGEEDSPWWVNQLTEDTLSTGPEFFSKVFVRIPEALPDGLQSRPLLPAGKQGGAMQRSSAGGIARRAAGGKVQTVAQASDVMIVEVPVEASERVGLQVAVADSLTTPEAQAMGEEPYIETQASLVSYVKHPLEQLLEWIDHRMLWLEEGWVKLWRWLRHTLGS